MPQTLTNYDAEIKNGVLRIPPNCTKLTKGEKRKVTTMAFKSPIGLASSWGIAGMDDYVKPGPVESETDLRIVDYTTKIELTGRGKTRPDVVLWVTVPVKVIQ